MRPGTGVGLDAMWGRLKCKTKPPTPPSEMLLWKVQRSGYCTASTTANESTDGAAIRGFDTTWSFIRICFSTLPLDQMLSQTAPAPTRPGGVIIIIIIIYLSEP